MILDLSLTRTFMPIRVSESFLYLRTCSTVAIRAHIAVFYKVEQNQQVDQVYV